MSYRPDHLSGPVAEGIGLRFLNEEWNDSISNGHLFTIQWNQSLDEDRLPELGLFRITYPRNGDVVYELVSNLTDGMNNANATCLWTPNHLDDELYTLWLSSSRDSRASWTASPPWRLKEHLLTREQSHHPPRRWAAPVVIPILIMLTVYTLGLTLYVIYRRRRNARREKESSEGDDADKESAESPCLLGDADRHPSVDTTATLAADDEEEVKKPQIWLLTQSASGSLLLASPRGKDSDSDATLLSPTSLSSEPLLASMSPISLAEPSHTSMRSEGPFIALPNPRDHRAVVASRLGRSLRVIVPSDDVRE
ncbi:uncharacterized protein TRIREDRAFT_111038 [Trichoderma reesei QM6a]|uniref:Predicted protein n=1 Tax=Hypocrea jecorina (strain QM6a) TaxID=431241 RepID=G0RTL5_HYPJQ|nr:uncharacterized protein TRIREDRAFT_111038 [Trichoderma reesei QM6a]EGR45454.1 predicted protein [Trichoderma reesei QM6a]